MIPDHAKRKVEFGDFQTPPRLAREVCNLLRREGLLPSSILEPTCGEGSFLCAAVDTFPGATIVRGFDYNVGYVQTARAALERHRHVRVERGDFFEIDWDQVASDLPEPVLIIGNPPWVTSAAVGTLGGANLPRKTNIDRVRGIDALTGRSNFDISEWMLRECMRWLEGRVGVVAVLCKTAVARKVLSASWGNHTHIRSAAVYRISAAQEFGVAVDACLFVVRVDPHADSVECEVYDSLVSATPSARFGMCDGRIVADIDAYDRTAHLYTDGLTGWRSGVKHDCSSIFELSPRNEALVNGLGEEVTVEPEVVFPLLKSSDIARGRQPRKYLLTPQRTMNESPAHLERDAPAAWLYLRKHSQAIGSRRSSIYKGRPQFSIFGIGPYSFSPWKVVISGLYKEFKFCAIGPYEGRPVLLDDTCYLFACDSEQEAVLLQELVSSSIATDFLSSLVFWDSKRPITAKLLNALDLAELARSMNRWTPTAKRIAERQMTGYSDQGHQALLFRESSLNYD